MEEKIAYTKRQAKRGKIKTSISGYLRNAIEHDYVFKKTPEKIIEANENSEEFVSVTERKKQDKKLLEEYFLSLGNDGYKEFVKEFTDHIKEIGN